MEKDGVKFTFLQLKLTNGSKASKVEVRLFLMISQSKKNTEGTMREMQIVYILIVK